MADSEEVKESRPTKPLPRRVGKAAVDEHAKLQVQFQAEVVRSPIASPTTNPLYASSDDSEGYAFAETRAANDGVVSFVPSKALYTPTAHGHKKIQRRHLVHSESSQALKDRSGYHDRLSGHGLNANMENVDYVEERVDSETNVLTTGGLSKGDSIDDANPDRESERSNVCVIAESAKYSSPSSPELGLVLPRQSVKSGTFARLRRRPSSFKDQLRVQDAAKRAFFQQRPMGAAHQDAPGLRSQPRGSDHLNEHHFTGRSVRGDSSEKEIREEEGTRIETEHLRVVHCYSERNQADSMECAQGLCAQAHYQDDRTHEHGTLTAEQERRRSPSVRHASSGSDDELPSSKFREGERGVGHEETCCCFEREDEKDRRRHEVELEMDRRRFEHEQEMDRRRYEVEQEMDRRRFEHEQEMDRRRYEVEQEMDRRRFEHEQEMDRRRYEREQEMDRRRFEGERGRPDQHGDRSSMPSSDSGPREERGDHGPQKEPVPEHHDLANEGCERVQESGQDDNRESERDLALNQLLREHKQKDLVRQQAPVPVLGGQYLASAPGENASGLVAAAEGLLADSSDDSIAVNHYVVISDAAPLAVEVSDG